MKKIMTNLIILVLSSITLFADEQGTLTVVGQTVPEFKVTTITEQEVDIKALRGKVVLINFFATWCSPCRAELPHLEKDVWQKFRGDEFVVIAIGREHSAEELIKFNKSEKLTLLIAPDPKRKVYSLFAEKNIPRNYLIDKNGKIVYQSMGFEETEFQYLINEIKLNLE